LPYSIPYSKDGVDLIELVAFEVQLFPHTRNVRIVKIGAIKIIEEIHETAESKDEKIKLLHQLALAWRILVASKIGDEAVGHVGTGYCTIEGKSVAPCR